MALKTGFCGLDFGVEAATGAPSGFGGSAIMDCGVQYQVLARGLKLWSLGTSHG